MKKFYEKPDVDFISFQPSECIMDEVNPDEKSVTEGGGWIPGVNSLDLDL